MPRQSIFGIPHLLREAGLVPGSTQSSGDRDSPARLSLLHCHGQGWPRTLQRVDTIPSPEPHILPVPFFPPPIPLELISHGTVGRREGTDTFDWGHRGGGSTQKLRCLQAGGRQQTCFHSHTGNPISHLNPQGWILVSGSPASTFQQPQNSQPSPQQR